MEKKHCVSQKVIIHLIRDFFCPGKINWSNKLALLCDLTDGQREAHYASNVRQFRRFNGSLLKFMRSRFNAVIISQSKQTTLGAHVHSESFLFNVDRQHITLNFSLLKPKTVDFMKNVSKNNNHNHST